MILATMVRNRTFVYRSSKRLNPSAERQHQENKALDSIPCLLVLQIKWLAAVQ